MIADYMAVFVDEAYGSVTQQSGGALLLATVFFAVQIYCDFSGYTHIAIGSARFLGIRLTENFDAPYLAKGCRDFWKRWHITLTKWFTKYVYIPLGGGRRGEKRKYFNIMAVFLLSGLWHGADIKFLIWGAFFGIWRILEEITARHRERNSGGCVQAEKAGTAWIRRAGCFGLVCISWVFFRSQSVGEAWEVLRRIFTLEAGGTFIADGMELVGAAARIGILALLPRILKGDGNGDRENAGRYYTAAVLMLLTGVCMLAIFDNGGGSSFIYFQF